MKFEPAKDYEKLRKVALEMFEADNACGCGFYNDDAWRTAYAKLQKLVGYKSETAVLGMLNTFDDLPGA
ncbi:MAG: hypothetical protein OEW08_14950 [Gammaproteobacteria bacterium]|nr:hypothetical protein [Gammaproteobacteria bacterium]